MRVDFSILNRISKSLYHRVTERYKVKVPRIHFFSLVEFSYYAGSRVNRSDNIRLWEEERVFWFIVRVYVLSKIVMRRASKRLKVNFHQTREYELFTDFSFFRDWRYYHAREWFKRVLELNYELDRFSANLYDRYLYIVKRNYISSYRNTRAVQRALYYAPDIYFSKNIFWENFNWIKRTTFVYKFFNRKNYYYNFFIKQRERHPYIFAERMSEVGSNIFIVDDTYLIEWHAWVSDTLYSDVVTIEHERYLVKPVQYYNRKKEQLNLPFLRRTIRKEITSKKRLEALYGLIR